MARQPDKKAEAEKPPRKRGGSPLLLAALVGLGSAAWVAWGDRLPGAFQIAEQRYSGLVAAFINDPNNAGLRADMIESVVDHYRETPAGKSLPIRDESRRVVGRFRIHRCDVRQPWADSADDLKRRTFLVELEGEGEMWHETGHRVRFSGGAEVVYVIDFRIEDWTVYSYFTCAELRNEVFGVTHIDHVLGKLFTDVVNERGREALREALEPGFTIVTDASGDSHVAFGRVGRGWTPPKGEFDPPDQDAETISNARSFLAPGFRDYIGPFELAPGDELRVLMELDTLGAPKPFGVDVLLLNAATFRDYDSLYPDALNDGAEGFRPTAAEARWNTTRTSFTRTGLRGAYYLVIDHTAFGAGERPAPEFPCEVRCYARVRRE